MMLYINWEGRNYDISSLRADLLNVTKGMKEPLYTFFYDVGVLITDSMPPDFSEVKPSRHGDMGATENWNLPIKDYEDLGPHIDIIPDEGKLAKAPANWDRHEDIGAMIWKWLQDEVIT